MARAFARGVESANGASMATHSAILTGEEPRVSVSSDRPLVVLFSPGKRFLPRKSTSPIRDFYICMEGCGQSQEDLGNSRAPTIIPRGGVLLRRRPRGADSPTATPVMTASQEEDLTRPIHAVYFFESRTPYICK